MTEATITAPSNIAFIKYWGAVDLKQVVPQNPSISMTLRDCVTTTSVRCVEASQHRLEVIEDGVRVLAAGSFLDRAVAHLERLREHFGVAERFHAVTRNSFPASAGIASSASGFAALTIAVIEALGVEVSAAERSDLARRSGSGSASRSVFGGYVEWPGADDDLAAAPLASAQHWPLCDVIALVQAGDKTVSSLDGHRAAASSPHFARRQEILDARLAAVRQAIADCDLSLLGPVLEEDAIELHLIAMSSRPPIYYWQPPTLAVMQAVRDLRAGGTAAWLTMDAGANVHVICTPEDEPEVAAGVAAVAGVRSVIRDRVGDGPARLEASLFDLPERDT